MRFLVFPQIVTIVVVIITFKKKSVATYVLTFSIFKKVGILSESILNLVPPQPQKHEPLVQKLRDSDFVLFLRIKLN